MVKVRSGGSGKQVAQGVRGNQVSMWDFLVCGVEVGL